MEVDLVRGEERRVDHRGDPSIAIIDQAKGRERTGLDAQDLPPLLRGGKPDASAGADPRMQDLKIDRLILGGDDQKQPALLVLEQEVLRELPLHRAAQRLAFLYRTMGGVGNRAGVDAESGEALEKALARAVHGGSPKVRWLRAGSFDGQAGGLPFGIAVFEAMNPKAALAQQRDCFEGQDAIGATTIGNDLSALGDVAQTLRQLAQRNVDGARQMPRREFVWWAHVENRDEPVLEATG